MNLKITSTKGAFSFKIDPRVDTLAFLDKFLKKHKIEFTDLKSFSYELEPRESELTGHVAEAIFKALRIGLRPKSGKKLKK